MDKKIDGNLYLDHLHAVASEKGIPLSGTFELTSRCNLDCKMCYIHRRIFDADAIKRELPAEKWAELADSAVKAGMLSVLLTGGEPFLRPDFGDIYRYCHSSGILISLNTNGTSLSASDLRLITDTPPYRVNLTLYGASEATYAALCGDGSAYKRAMNTVMSLHEAGIPLKINYSVTPLNRDDMEQVYSFCHSLGLPMQVSAYMFPPARACENSSCDFLRLSETESAAERLKYDRLRFDDETFRSRKERILNGAPPPDPDSECLDLPTEKIRCRAGKSCFWITWEGEMRPCGMMTRPSFPVFNNGKEEFCEAWNNVKAAASAIPVPAKCSACKVRNLCGACPAASLTETGMFENVPEYLCRVTSEYIRLLKNES